MAHTSKADAQAAFVMVALQLSAPVQARARSSHGVTGAPGDNEDDDLAQAILASVETFLNEKDVLAAQRRLEEEALREKQTKKTRHLETRLRQLEAGTSHNEDNDLLRAIENSKRSYKQDEAVRRAIERSHLDAHPNGHSAAVLIADTMQATTPFFLAHLESTGVLSKAAADVRQATSAVVAPPAARPGKAVKRAVYEAGGGGDCMYYSIAWHVKKDAEDRYAAMLAVRTEIFDYVLRSMPRIKERFAALHDPDDPDFDISSIVQRFADPGQSMGDYLVGIVQAGRCGDAFIAMIASMRYASSFVVERVDENTGKVVERINTKSAFTGVYVLEHSGPDSEGGHYRPVVYSSGDPDTMTQAQYLWARDKYNASL
jgi:hypothetical protein